MNINKGQNTWSIGVILMLFSIVSDQLTKVLIQNNIQPNSGVEIIGSFLRITYIKNPGGAFSTRFGGNLFYIIVASIACIFITIYIIKMIEKNKILSISLFVIMSGAIGNLIDRIRIGEVIDWIDIGFSSTRWPTFNIADSAIVVGLVILIFTNTKNDLENNINCPDGNNTDTLGFVSGIDGNEPQQKPDTEAHKG